MTYKLSPRRIRVQTEERVRKEMLDDKIRNKEEEIRVLDNLRDIKDSIIREEEIHKRIILLKSDIEELQKLKGDKKSFFTQPDL